MKSLFSKQRRKESRPAKRGFFSKVKNKMLGAVLIAGLAMGATSCRCTGTVDKTKRTQVQHVQERKGNDCECDKIPEIKKWAKKRSLDPLLVCAVAKAESSLNPHEAAKVCRTGYDAPDCFQSGPSADPGYNLAYDEMYIPEETPGNPVQLVNDIVAPGQSPKWRWLSFGLMQNLEPPYHFWPASHRTNKLDGLYYDVFKRAGISQSTDLDAAKACNSNFNPFDVNDSLCLGTKKVKYLLAAARAWIWANRDKLNWNVLSDKEKTRLLEVYIAANKYAGIWDMTGRARLSTTEWPAHPRCPPSIRNGDCWAIGFKDSWSVSKQYCESNTAQGDNRCKDGKPRREPPGYCYGYGNFMQFVNDCEMPFLPVNVDVGAVVLTTYLNLKQKCK